MRSIVFRQVFMYRGILAIMLSSMFAWVACGDTEEGGRVDKIPCTVATADTDCPKGQECDPTALICRDPVDVGKTPPASQLSLLGPATIVVNAAGVYTASFDRIPELNMHYRFFIGDDEVQAWQTSPNWTFRPTADHVGTQSVKVEALGGEAWDNKDTTAMYSASLSVEVEDVVETPTWQPNVVLNGPTYLDAGETGTYVAQAEAEEGAEFYLRFKLDGTVVLDWTAGTTLSEGMLGLSWDYATQIADGGSSHYLIVDAALNTEGVVVASAHMGVQVGAVRPVVTLALAGPATVDEGDNGVFTAEITPLMDDVDFFYRFYLDDVVIRDWDASQTFIYNPDFLEQGLHTLKAEVTETLGLDPLSTDSLDVMVQNVDALLEVNLSGQTNVAEGETHLYRAMATNPSGANNIYFRFRLNGEVIQDWSTQNTFTWQIAYDVSELSPNHTLEVNAAEQASGPAEAMATLNIAVQNTNQEPVISNFQGPNTANAFSNAIFTVTATDPDGQNLDIRFLVDGAVRRGWSLDNSWTWNHIDSADVGVRIVTVEVTDDTAFHAPENTVSVFHTVEIIRVDTDPLVTSFIRDVANPKVGDDVTFTATAADLDNDFIYFRFLLNNTEEQGWSPFADWTWTVPVNLLGTQEVTVEVSNSETGPARNSDQMQVVILVNNEEPTFDAVTPIVGPPAVDQQTTVVYSAQVYHPLNETMEFQWLLDDVAQTPWQSSISWTWDIGCAVSGVHKVEVRARDSSMTPVPKTLNVTVVDSTIPTISISGSTNIDEGVNTVYSATASDTCGVTLTYRLLVEGVEQITWQTSPDFSYQFPFTGPWSSGIRTVSIETMDGTNVAGDNLQVTVNQVNQTPTVALAANNTTIDEGATLILTATGTDVDFDTLEYRFWRNENMIQDWSISNGWTWITDHTSSGVYEFRVEIRDPSSTTPQDSSLLSVIVNNKDQAPVITGINGPLVVQESESWTYNVIANDPEGVTLKYRWFDSITGLPLNDFLNSTDQWTYDFGCLHRNHAIKVEATDGTWLVTFTINVTVKDDTSPPNLTLYVQGNPTEYWEGEKHTFVAVGSDDCDDQSTDDLYRYTIDDDAIPVQDWSNAPDYTWTIPTDEAGTHYVRVDFMDVPGGPAVSEIMEIDTLNPVPVVRIEGNLNGLFNTNLTWVAVAEDPDNDLFVGAPNDLGFRWLNDYQQVAPASPQFLEVGLDNWTFWGVDQTADTTYTITVEVWDADGAHQTASKTVNIIDNTGPYVVSTTPADGEEEIHPNAVIDVDFSQGMGASETEGAFGITPTTAGTFSWVGNTMTFTPTNPLIEDQTYTITISTAAESSGNVPLAFSTSAVFDVDDVTNPTVDSNVPVDGATDVSVTTTIQVSFSEDMDDQSVLEAFDIDPVVPFTIQWSGNGEDLTVTPLVSLQNDTTYTVTVSGSGEDLAENTIGPNTVFSFTTIP